MVRGRSLSAQVQKIAAVLMGGLLATAVVTPVYAHASETKSPFGLDKVFQVLDESIKSESKDTFVAPSDTPVLIELGNEYVFFPVVGIWESNISEDGLISFFEFSDMSFCVMTNPVPNKSTDFIKDAQKLALDITTAYGFENPQIAGFSSYELDGSAVVMTSVVGEADGVSLLALFTTVFSADAYSTVFSVFPSDNQEDLLMASILHESVAPAMGQNALSADLLSQLDTHLITVDNDIFTYQVAADWKPLAQGFGDTTLITYIPADSYDANLQIYIDSSVSNDPESDANKTFDSFIASNNHLKNVEKLQWLHYAVDSSYVYYVTFTAEAEGTPYVGWITMVFGKDGYIQLAALCDSSQADANTMAELSHACRSIQLHSAVPVNEFETEKAKTAAQPSAPEPEYLGPEDIDLRHIITPSRGTRGA